MSTCRHLQPPVMPSRPVPTTPAAWVDEILIVAAITPRMAGIPAAIAARGWQVSAGFIARVAELAEEETLRLAEVWDEPAEMPDTVMWAASYLAGHIYLDHLRPPKAVAIMIESVTRLGGTAAPVVLQGPADPGVVDESGHAPDYRGRL